MKRIPTSGKRQTENPKRRKDDRSSGKKRMELENESETEKKAKGDVDETKRELSKESVLGDELQWTPDLIWTSPPKPMPNLDEHPLLKNLPAVSSSQAQYRLPYLPPVFPNIPPPTLYMEPLAPLPSREPGERVAEQSKSKETPTTPLSSPPVSPHSCPSSGSAIKLQSPTQGQSSSEGVCQTAAGGICTEQPRCTLHYYRRVQNAEAEGFHVIQGQVWHGQTEELGEEGQDKRRWRRHQWLVDG